MADIWEPTVRMYYDIAASGGDVDALVAWNKDFTTRVAFGSLEAYDDNGGLVKGLRGSLDQWFVGGVGLLEPMEVQIAEPGPQDAYIQVTITSSGEQRMLDAPIVNPPWAVAPAVGWTHIEQSWWQGHRREDIIMSLINVWAWRNLTPLYRGAWELAQNR